MTALVPILATTAVGPSVSACSCPGDTETGLVVLVIGGGIDGTDSGLGGFGGAAGDPEPPCRAQVDVADSKELECNVSGGNCLCRGLNDQPGTYEINATLDGEVEATTVKITKEDRCTTRTENVCMFGESPEDWP
jgi:hypothetical protein